MSQFKVQLANLLKARFPLIYLSTWEEERVANEIREVCMNSDLIRTTRQLFIWSITTGLVGANIEKDTNDPIKALEAVEKFPNASVFIFRDMHVFFGDSRKAPDVRVIRKIRDVIPGLKQSPKPKNIIFVSPVMSLPDDLQKDITVIDFDLPEFKEILQLLVDMIESNSQNDNIVIDLSEVERSKLASAAMGLTLQEAENAIARSIVTDGRLDINDLSIILEEKRQIIKKTGVLEYVQSDLDMKDVGGLENLKRWLKKRAKAWEPSAKKYNLPSPKGVLITGVPGCGKSLIAKSVSSSWKMPLLRLDMGKIFAGIVGSSEENMRRSIKTAEAISPCVLWIDEIEKGFSGLGGSGDGGTAARIFGTFLTWMQEKVKPVFVLATANNIKALPAEFMRKGRFDEIFFVDLPTKRERVEIFKVHILKRVTREVIGDWKPDGKTLLSLAELTEGFVGAEIEEVVISALFEAFSEDRSLVIEDFEKAIRNTVPLSKTQAEQIRETRQWANDRAVAATPAEDLADYPVADPSGGNSEKDEVWSTRGGRQVDV